MEGIESEPLDRTPGGGHITHKVEVARDSTNGVPRLLPGYTHRTRFLGFDWPGLAIECGFLGLS